MILPLLLYWVFMPVKTPPCTSSGMCVHKFRQVYICPQEWPVTISLGVYWIESGKTYFYKPVEIEIK